MKEKSPLSLTVNLSPWIVLTEEQARGQLVAFNIGPDGLAYLAFTQERLDDRIEETHGSSVRPLGRWPQTYRVLAVSDMGCVLDVTITSGQSMNFHDVQPLGDDLLLVCGRSHRRSKDDYDQNARVYSRDGVFLREFLLGDGIESVQVSPDDTIWTSYFDQGVLGNYGWSEPVGASGLVAWNAAGEKLFEFPPHAGLEPILSCYAINVSSDRDVWLYYHTKYPLVHLRDRRVRAFWNMPVSGSVVMAIGLGYVLIDGGHNDHETFFLLKLGAPPQAQSVARIQFCDVDGRSLEPMGIAGRRDAIFLLVGRSLYRWSVLEATRSAMTS